MIKDKTILITGASSGIGKATALELASKGLHLILSAKDAADLEVVAQKCKLISDKVYTIVSDLSSEDGVLQLANQVLKITPDLDVLFLNAGISQRARAEDTKPEVLRAIMEVNFFSTVFLSQNLLKALKSKKGHILVTTSIVGRFGFPLRSAYSASKHALYGYFESLRLEHPELAVSIVCPGRVKTNISRYSLQADGSVYGKLDPGQAQGISSAKAAKKIVRLIHKPKRELLIGGSELLMVYLKKYFPALFYVVAKKTKPV